MDIRRLTLGAGAFLFGFAVIVLAGKSVFPGLWETTRVPTGLYLQGLVVGVLYGLMGIGLVLIYRANRIINFAQGELGAFAAVLASQLFTIFHWPFLAAALTGLLATVLSSLIVEFGVIRRFRKAPRLILTVATIGVAQILGAIEIALPAILSSEVSREQVRTTLQSPWGIRFEFGSVRFSPDHFVVLVVAPAILIGLAAFFRLTRYGVAARGAAENAERARLLGVPVSRVSLVVWGVAGLLSAVTAILRAPILGFQFGAIAGQGLILRALAAAVIGRMQSLPITLLAAVLITMAEQTIFFSFGRSGPVNGFLLATIVVSLLVQRNRLGRVDPGASTWRAVQEIRRIPKELRKLPEVRWSTSGLWVVLAISVLGLPFLLRPAQISLASAILIYSMVGISLVMLTGWSGNVSLGQWGLVGVGAMFAGSLITRGTSDSIVITVLFAGITGSLVAVAIGLPALRIRGLFLGVTTLGFAVTAHSWFLQWDIMTPLGAIPRPLLLGRIDIGSEFAFYYVCAATLALTILAGRNIRRTRLGRNFIALRDNEIHAQALGVRPVRTKLAAFAISGFFASTAGGMLAFHQQSIRFDRFPAEFSLAIFAMVVIGGMGSMTGAILGAVYVRSIQFFLSPAWQFLATGFGMLILLLIFPGGLGQLVFEYRDRLLRRVASRRGLVVPSLVADRRREDEIFTPPPAPTAPQPKEELVVAGEPT